MKEQNYLDIIYPSFKGSYPYLLVYYLAKRFGLKPGMRLLDLGAGAGTHTAAFNSLGLIASGIIKEDCNLEREMLPYKDNTFDIVFGKSIIEHVSNTENVVLETRRVLKPGGRAIIMTPDWRTDFKYMYDDPQHVSPFTRKGLQDTFRFYEFVDVDCRYFWALPFLWRYPYLEPLRWLISLLPDRFKWKDKNESNQRTLVRHSKERVLLCVARKP